MKRQAAALGPAMLRKTLKAVPQKSPPPMYPAKQSVGISRSVPPAKVRSLSVLGLSVHHSESKSTIPQNNAMLFTWVLSASAHFAPFFQATQFHWDEI